MNQSGSIFLDFSLPNATTWFYFSFLLAVALFFKFSRLLSVRNVDVITLYLPIPGMLLLMESGGSARLGYVLLWIASGWMLLRCFWDLILVQRPALKPNLSPGGLGWLGIALFLSLIAVAFREPMPVQPDADPEKNTKGPLLESVQKTGEELLVGATRMQIERIYALLCHFAILAGLVIVGARHFQDLHSGIAAATFYVLLPFVYYLLPHANLNIGQWHHIWPMALLVWAVVTYHRPLMSGFILGLAIGSVYFPILVVGVWFSFYRGRGAWRFLLAVMVGVGLCLFFLAMLAWLSGEGWSRFTIMMPVALRDWLPWVPVADTVPGIWQGMHWAYRMPVFLLCLTLVILTFFWPSPKNLAHLLALNCAVLISTQFWYADRGGVYVLWYLPLFLLMVFRPNLSNGRPPEIPENDWLSRVGQRVRQRIAVTHS